MWIEGWQLKTTGKAWSTLQNNLTAALRAHKWEVINLPEKFKSFWRPRVKYTQVWKWTTPRFGSRLHCLLAMLTHALSLSLSPARASPRLIPPLQVAVPFTAHQYHSFTLSFKDLQNLPPLTTLPITSFLYKLWEESRDSTGYDLKIGPQIWAAALESKRITGRIKSEEQGLWN